MDAIWGKLQKYRIGIWPIEGFALMSYASMVEPFRAANLLRREDFYEVVTISGDGLPVQSSGDAMVGNAKMLEAGDRLDLLIVIAGGDPLSFVDNKVFSHLQRQARMGTRIGGVSGGPAILVKAGIMGGHKMTVHWEHAEGLLEIAPDLQLERSLFVIDRERVTCAGGTAPLDLAHALIAEHHGPVFAQFVSDWFLHTEVRDGSAPQRSGLVPRIGTTNQSILDAVVAMENNIAEPISLEELASVAGLSERQLNRLFGQKMGAPAMRYYRKLRTEKAHNLLINSSLDIAEIAAATGFANSGHLARIYKENYGQNPSAART